MGEDHWKLTNLRFADDVILIGTTFHQIQGMLEAIQLAAGARGLVLHPDNIKISSNATRETGRPKERKVQIGDVSIGVVPLDGSVKYLGKLLRI